MSEFNDTFEHNTKFRYNDDQKKEIEKVQKENKFKNISSAIRSIINDHAEQRKIDGQKRKDSKK